MGLFAEKFFKAKKKSLFFLGLLVTSLFGSVSGYLRVHVSKDDDADSLLASTAHADAQAWVWGSGDGAGEGCGGCSGDSGGG